METKIHTIKTYEELFSILKTPNPQQGYLFLPDNYKYIKKVDLELKNTVVYTDLIIRKNNNVFYKFFPSFNVSYINQVKIESPFFFNTTIPIEIPQIEKPTIDYVLKYIFTRILGQHIPDFHFEVKL